MAGHIEHGDAGRPLAAEEILDDFGALLFDSLLDAPVEIEALLEIDVDQVIAPDDAVQRKGAAMDVEAMETRKISGFWNQVLGNLLEILQLVTELFDEFDF
jgi:hypothetical protein